jgi:hypothetical protein
MWTRNTPITGRYRILADVAQFLPPIAGGNLELGPRE